MRKAILLVGLAVLAGCSTQTSETMSRDASFDVPYPPPPSGLKAVRAGCMDFEDKTGKKIGAQAGEQMETLATNSGRFRMIERLQLKNLLKEQSLEGIVDPSELAKSGRVRGVDYLILGAITNFRVKVVKESSRGGILDRVPVVGSFAPLKLDGASTEISTDVGVDIKVVNATTGEIVAKQMEEVKKTDKASAFGIRIFGIGGDAKNEQQIDEDSRGKILRFAIDQTFRKMLPTLDMKLTQPMAAICPKCKTEIEGGNKFCSKCGTGTAPIACKCGAELDPGVKFCGKCGAKTEAPK